MFFLKEQAYFINFLVKKPKIWDYRLMQLKPALFGVLTGLFIGVFFIFVIKPTPSKSAPKIETSVLENSKNENIPQESTLGTTTESPAKQEQPASTSFTQLADLIKSKKGIYSLYIEDLTTEKTFEYNSDQIIYGASLYKLLVGGAVYDLISQNKLSLNYEYTYEGQDFTGGTGVIQTQSVGSAYSVKELLNYLFKDSDNIAQNILVRNITEGAVSDFYKKIVDSNTSTGQFYGSGKTTATEVAHILINLHKLEDWTRPLKKAFFDYMIDTEFDDRISSGLDDSLIFSHKIGSWPDSSWHDCGIVFDDTYSNPVVVCLMSKQVDYSDFLEVSKQTGYFINSLLLP
jgi:hypothetical protein